jgi:thioredoxin reductase
LVVGSGPGGLAAALSAARTVVKATLVERFGCFGGNITAVGVEGFAVINMKKQLSLEVLPMSLKNVLKL